MTEPAAAGPWIELGVDREGLVTVGLVWDERHAWHATGSFGPALGSPCVRSGEEVRDPFPFPHAAWAGRDITSQQEAVIRAAEALAARLR